jgi:hypothetical protein
MRLDELTLTYRGDFRRCVEAEALEQHHGCGLHDDAVAQA